MKRLAVPLGATLWLALAALPAAAQPPAAPYFVANCFNCHGTDGKASDAIPPLAGRDRAYLFTALQGYKDGSKPATIMHQLAKGYTDDEIGVLADYFSRQKN